MLACYGTEAQCNDDEHFHGNPLRDFRREQVALVGLTARAV
jgi:hypothetical protein